MRGEKLMDALNDLDEDLILEANLIRQRKRNKKKSWKWVALASCIVLFIYMAFRLLPPETSSESELAMLTLPLEENTGAGMESYHVKEITDLVSGNPWKEEEQIASLPVFKNPVEHSQEKPFLSEPDDKNMQQLFDEITHSLGITEPFEIKKEKRRLFPGTLKGKINNMEIVVDQNLMAEIRFSPGIHLPKEYALKKNTYDETQKLAEYLKKEYRVLIGFEEPKISIEGGDYTISGERNYSFFYYTGQGDPVSKLIHYTFNRIWFFTDEEGTLTLIRIQRPNLSQKIGDYPIISVEEAKNLLESGHYLSPLAFPGQKHIAKVELNYRWGVFDEIFVPYYRFYVEHQELAKHGTKNYVVYSVPAIDKKYLTNLPLWDGRFNR